MKCWRVRMKWVENGQKCDGIFSAFGATGEKAVENMRAVLYLHYGFDRIKGVEGTAIEQI